MKKAERLTNFEEVCRLCDGRGTETQGCRCDRPIKPDNGYSCNGSRNQAASDLHGKLDEYLHDKTGKIKRICIAKLGYEVTGQKVPGIPSAEEKLLQGNWRKSKNSVFLDH